MFFFGLVIDLMVSQYQQKELMPPHKFSYAWYGLLFSKYLFCFSVMFPFHILSYFIYPLSRLISFISMLTSRNVLYAYGFDSSNSCFVRNGGKEVVNAILEGSYSSA
jgi:hypothetical protein